MTARIERKHYYSAGLIVGGLVLMFALMGCQSMGLTTPDDGARDFFDRADRQSGGGGL